MGQTPTWQLPYPAPADPADVPLDMQELCNRLEVVLTQLKTGGAIPGEIRMWSGSVVPPLATYGHWVWADGGSYSAVTYPLAAGNIATAWKTHGGKPDPGANQFRVPDLRGSNPVGMDAMPGGARANRITRAAAATLAAVAGEEYHTLLLAEMASHGHTVGDPGHNHSLWDPAHNHALQDPGHLHTLVAAGSTTGSIWGAFVGNANMGNINTSGAATAAYNSAAGTGMGVNPAGTGISVGANGGGGAHENLAPTTFVPWIVKLDD